MLNGRIGGFAPPDNREEVGRFLRHSFPLGLASFEGLIGRLEEERKFLDVGLPEPQFPKSAHDRRR
jgi:hypothetical protein